MRTIKFRAFDDGKMIYPTGALSKLKRFIRIIREDAIIMQFTGLLDKNGKEIYEGDINQYGYVIKYCEEKALFGEYGTRNGIDYDILMSYPIDSKSQIIKGNIYENPELLEK